MKSLIALFLMASFTVMAQTELPLWNGDMPGAGAAKPEIRDTKKEPGVIRITNVSEPTLKLFLVESEAPPRS